MTPLGVTRLFAAKAEQKRHNSELMCRWRAAADAEVKLFETNAAVLATISNPRRMGCRRRSRTGGIPPLWNVLPYPTCIRPPLGYSPLIPSPPYQDLVQGWPMKSTYILAHGTMGMHPAGHAWLPRVNPRLNDPDGAEFDIVPGREKHEKASLRELLES